MPLILQPTGITSHSNTIVDNIFSNVIDPDIISGNSTATISDHLAQLAITPNMFGNISDLLKIDELNANKSNQTYLDKINMLLDTYARLKRIHKYKLKFNSKPWITLGLQKSISVKNRSLKNFINKKDPILKEEFHTNHKKYRNLLSSLMRKSKQAY